MFYMSVRVRLQTFSVAGFLFAGLEMEGKYIQTSDDWCLLAGL